MLKLDLTLNVYELFLKKNYYGIDEYNQLTKQTFSSQFNQLVRNYFL